MKNLTEIIGIESHQRLTIELTLEAMSKNFTSGHAVTYKHLQDYMEYLEIASDLGMETGKYHDVVNRYMGV